jgi:hypothetical protein
MLTSFWQPPPSYTLFDTKTFKAGLAIHGRDVFDGDMVFHVHVADDGKAFQDSLPSSACAASRRRRASSGPSSLTMPSTARPSRVFDRRRCLRAKSAK